MQRLVQFAGYVALVATASALVVSAFLALPDVSNAMLGIGGGIALVGGVTATVEYGVAFEGLDDSTVGRTAVVDVLAVTTAAGVAYGLSVHAGFGPVVASALVGVAAGLTVPEVDTAAYCGSFVGMASPSVFPTVTPVLASGLVAGFAFVGARGTFTGFGGKLGTLALFGCTTTVLLTGVDYAAGAALQWSSAVFVVPVAVAGAVATAVLSIRCELGSVLGSGLVGLVAGLSLPVILPGVGDLLSPVVFCSSFVGMSSSERFGNEIRVGLAGALCGLVFVAVAPVFGGSGGKLGTVAFVSCLALFGAEELHESFGPRTA